MKNGRSVGCVFKLSDRRVGDFPVRLVFVTLREDAPVHRRDIVGRVTNFCGGIGIPGARTPD